MLFRSLSFDFTRIGDPGRPTDSRSFAQFSPRLALVVLPTPGVSVKLMAARAFRAPSPTELAGAHTFSLASNIDQLRPELVTTWEAAAEWRIARWLTARANIFLTKFENQIAYSAQNNNLSTNLYSLKTEGAETEVLFSAGAVSGFVNYSYARRLDEKIQDVTIAPSPNRLTWAPAHTANAGVTATWNPFTIGLSTHIQSRVDRRASDVGVQALPFGVGVQLDMDRYRGDHVPSWVTVDLKASARLFGSGEVALSVTNLLDREYSLVKVGPFPFDYTQEGRRFLVWGSWGF